MLTVNNRRQGIILDDVEAGLGSGAIGEYALSLTERIVQTRKAEK
jgi:hypothetical protein